MLFALLALHLALGTAVLAWPRRLARRGLVVGALAPLAVLVWLAVAAPDVGAAGGVTDAVTWVPELGLRIDLRVDTFSAVMLLLVAGIGVLVFAYGWSYFPDSRRTARAAGLLTLFAGSMLGLVVSDNMLFLYVCWELTSVTSYLLIGLDDADPAARSAALHALLVTGLGGLAMLAGFVMLGQEAGSYQLSTLLAAPPGGAMTEVALVLVLLGAFTKSAQYPFHSWLPGAMVAPTPISAYLHSAAMVMAGVYLVARFAPAFAATGIWQPLVVSIGLLTMIAGGLRALLPFDLKQLLALGTISQLGFLMVLFGMGQPAATAAGCVLLLVHGIFKAALFMVVGIVDHGTHTRDIRELPRLASGWTPTRVVAWVSAASMAGLPPLAGFIAKEEAYGALVDGSIGDRLVLAGIAAGSVLTVAYSVRLAVALWRPELVAEADVDRRGPGHAPGRSFVAPAGVLAVLTVAMGLLPGAWSGLIDGAARALDGDAQTHLALWHGFEPALVLSVLTLAAGAAMFAAREPISRVLLGSAVPVSGTSVYEATTRAALRVAALVTGVMQSGSLPIYAAIVLATAAIAPLTALLSGTWWPGPPEVTGAAIHVPIAALLVAAGIATTLARRRFAAALLLGVVGYGMAVLFVAQGAPDLALTQFGVETLSVVVFLLVLRRLPDRFERRTPAIGRAYRLAASTAVFVFVALMAIAASGARTGTSVSQEMVRRALPDGHGRNVVNVILVDIRGLDTVGEITVLVVAGLGIVALARAGRRPRARPRRSGTVPADQGLEP